MHNRYGSGKKVQIKSDLSLFFAFSTTVWAFVGGALSGAVTGANGAAIAGARVIAVSAAQGLQTKTSTDAKGVYRFPALAVGQYDLKVEAPGYKPSVHKVVIHVDDKVRLDIVLEPETPLAALAPSSKATDQASSSSDAGDPFNLILTRAFRLRYDAQFRCEQSVPPSVRSLLGSFEENCLGGMAIIRHNARRRSRVAVAGYTEADDTPRVQLAVSSDSGFTFGKPTVVSMRDTLGYASTVLNRNGGALVSWIEEGASSAKALVRLVSPAGADGRVIPIAEGSRTRLGYPKLGHSSSETWIAWGDPKTGVKTAQLK